ncbi:MAG: hypothetical protein QW327_06340 [Candidatus Odinarchaeota archaeon]
MSLNNEDVKNFIKAAWSSPSIIVKTPDYLYILKKEGDKWTELSYTFGDKRAERRSLNADDALLYLIEELTKSLVQYSNSLKEHIIVDNSKLNEILESV